MRRKVKGVRFHKEQYEFSERTLWKFYSALRDTPTMEPERALANAMGCSPKRDAIKYLKRVFGDPVYKSVVWELLKSDPYR